MADNVGHQIYGIIKRKYAEEHGRPLNGNVHRAASMLKRIAEDIGVQETLDLVDFYFSSRHFHDLDWFIFNYNVLSAEKQLAEMDAERRKKIRDRTRQRLIELGAWPLSSDGEDGLQTLMCQACGTSWTRTKRRGRPPKKCDECKES